MRSRTVLLLSIADSGGWELRDMLAIVQQPRGDPPRAFLRGETSRRIVSRCPFRLHPASTEWVRCAMDACPPVAQFWLEPLHSGLRRTIFASLPRAMNGKRALPYVGISGWRYPPWRGVFYPPGLRQAEELAFASRQFSSIEVNGSFYSLIRPETYQAWYDETPPGFVFSVKGARYITHLKRLKEVEAPLANFFGSGVLRLREKLGPVLWQLPPQTRFDPERLARFFELLPRTTAQAAALASRHDQRLVGRCETRALCKQPVRHALEVRHPSFAVPAFLDLLREHRIALCVADSAGLYPCIREVTADFVYVRLHGEKELYTSGYGPAALADWARWIRVWLETGDVFVYFDNDLKVRAPFDAMNLQRLLDGQHPKRLPVGLARRAPTPIVSGPTWRGVGGPRR